MAISTRLRAYLALERVMVDLDREGDPLADAIRDRMDPIWYALTAEDRSLLDSRTGDIEGFAGKIPDVPKTSLASVQVRYAFDGPRLAQAAPEGGLPIDRLPTWSAHGALTKAAWLR